MSMQLDQLDKLAASVFDGYLVRKDLVRKYSRQYPIPTYVVEFLLGRYCASVDESEIAEGLEIVEKQLKDRTVRTGEEELFKARAKETGSVRIIDILRARLDAKNDCYVAELPSLNLRDVRIDDQPVRDNERMLTDGFCAEVTLTYDGIIAQEKGGRLFDKTPLFRSAAGRTGMLIDRPMHRVDAYEMIRRRTAEAGFKGKLGCHVFRASGITAYLEAGGTFEKAQAMAAHESPRTTKLYDRTGDEITLDEVERIPI